MSSIGVMSDSGFGVDDDDVGFGLESERRARPRDGEGTLRAARERLLDAVVVGAGISGEWLSGGGGLLGIKTQKAIGSRGWEPGHGGGGYLE